MKKIKRSTLIPSLLFVYLCVMAFIGRRELVDGNYTFYFGVIGATLVCIVLLHFVLKRKERILGNKQK